MNYQNINLNDIDFEDRLFYLRNQNESKMQRYIENMPYNPIWVQEKESGMFRIVDGFLITQLLTNGKTPQNTIPAFIFPKNNPIITLWNRRIDKRFTENNLTVVGFYESLLELLKDQNLDSVPDVLKTVFKKLKIRDCNPTLQRLEAIVSKIALSQSFTDLHQLGFYDIESLATFNSQDLIKLSHLFSELNLKGKKLSTTLSIIKDLEKGYSLSLVDLLNDKNIVRIIEEIPVHLRYKTLRQYLETLRYPRLNDHQKKWQNLLKIIKPPARIKIKHDPFFESDELQIIINVSSHKELEQTVRDLQNKITITEFKHLFTLI